MASRSHQRRIAKNDGVPFRRLINKAPVDGDSAPRIRSLIRRSDDIVDVVAARAALASDNANSQEAHGRAGGMLARARRPPRRKGRKGRLSTGRALRRNAFPPSRRAASATTST